MNRSRLLALAVALAGLASVAHLPALSAGFIWDDDDHLTQNPYVASPTGLRDIWSSLAASRYYPLTLTTFWVFRQLFGLNPLPYHALNLVLHAANAVLLWLVLRRLGGPRFGVAATADETTRSRGSATLRGAWLAAALWAVHPVTVETVAWVTELKNIQSMFFMLAALWWWLDAEAARRATIRAASPATDLVGREARRVSRRRFWLALAAFAAALTSKPATVTLPVILLLCAWWQQTPVNGRRVLPFFALAAGMSLLTIAEQHRHVLGAGGADWRLTFTERFIVAGNAVWFYAGKLLLPLDLSFVYPRWDLRTESLLPVAALAALAAALWVSRRQPWARAALFGGACFVVLLAPVLGFFDIYYFRFSFVADHFNYLPSAALLALAPAALPLRDRRGQILAGALAVAVLAGLSWQRAAVFRTDRQLWEDTVAQNPDAGLAHNNLGAIDQRLGRPDLAIAHYAEAVRLLPDMAEPRLNLGQLLVARGEYDRARAILRDTRHAHAHFWLGVIAEETGDEAEAIRQYVQTLQMAPEFPDTYVRLGELRWRRGERDRAVNCFQTALRLNPRNDRARAGLRRAQEAP